MPYPSPTPLSPDASTPAADDATPPAMQRGSPVNTVLIAGSILVTLWTSWGQDASRLLPFLISLSPAASPGGLEEVFHGQVWRLFTPMFLHYNVQHLGFNMLGMYNLGRPLECVSGSRAYLFLCLTLALLSDVGQYYVMGLPNFGGMSGVLYGLFGYIWMRGRCDPGFTLQLPTQTIVIALVWFVACFTGYLGPIANTAHSVGLIVGAIWGIVAGRAAARRLRIAFAETQPDAGTGTSGIRGG